MEERINQLKQVAGSEIGEMLEASLTKLNQLSDLAIGSGKSVDILAYEREKKNLLKTIAALETSYGISFFNTLVDVHKYLVDSGYDIAERTIYEHKRQKKIVETENKKYLLSDVIDYANKYLKKKVVNNNSVSLAEQKMISEIEYKNKKIERENLFIGELSGSLISRDVVGREFASRIEFIKRYFEDIVGSLPMVLVGKDEKDIRDILKIKLDYVLEQYSKELELVKNRKSYDLVD